jgi:hypothetical protein
MAKFFAGVVSIFLFCTMSIGFGYLIAEALT